jgi:hypothetical protein
MVNPSRICRSGLFRLEIYKLIQDVQPTTLRDETALPTIKSAQGWYFFMSRIQKEDNVSCGRCKVATAH